MPRRLTNALSNSGRLVREIVRARLVGRPGAEQQGVAVHLDHRQAVEQREGEDMVRRLRTAALVGLCIWPSFIPIDVLIASDNAELLSSLLVSRLVGFTLSLASYLSLRNADRASATVEFSRVPAFVLACILIAAMSMQVDGIRGAYAPGIMLAIMLRASFVAEPWRKGLTAYLPMSLAFPATVLATAAFDEQVAAQLRDTGLRASFILESFFGISATVTGIVSSNALWKLRREAYEARHLGRYRLKQRIGRGGMGEVWIAHHLGLKQDIALKVLSSGLCNEQNAIARFEREVLAISRLTHPNTVRILDHGVSPEGIWFYAMELLRGSDLRVLLEREGPLSVPRTVALMTQVCGSLAEAHAKGVIHRDLKPSNIFVICSAGEPEFIKVFDFGLAKLTQEPESRELTCDGPVGTPLYMAPETLRHGTVSTRSDVYALGCLLYEMLAGCPPFENGSLLALLEQHRDHPVTPPSIKIGRELPFALEAIVMRCLAKDPDDRYGDARELGSELTSAA